MDRLRCEGVRAVSPNGVLGDPRGATASEGERVLAELIAGCTAALEALLVAASAHA
jgi:creatinine amidohydrolase